MLTSPNPIEIIGWKCSIWNKSINIEKPTTRRGTNNESNIDGTCFDEMQTGPVGAKVVEKEEKKNRAQPTEEPIFFSRRTEK